MSPSEAQQPHCRACCDAQGSCRLHDLCRQLHRQQACVICVLQYDILTDTAGCVAQQQSRLRRGRQQRRRRSKQRGDAGDGVHHIGTAYHVEPARKLLLRNRHRDMMRCNEPSDYCSSAPPLLHIEVPFHIEVTTTHATPNAGWSTMQCICQSPAALRCGGRHPTPAAAA
jgi:hypothetical protein